MRSGPTSRRTLVRSRRRGARESSREAVLTTDRALVVMNHGSSGPPAEEGMGVCGPRSWLPRSSYWGRETGLSLSSTRHCGKRVEFPSYQIRNQKVWGGIFGRTNRKSWSSLWCLARNCQHAAGTEFVDIDLVQSFCLNISDNAYIFALSVLTSTLCISIDCNFASFISRTVTCYAGAIPTLKEI